MQINQSHFRLIHYTSHMNIVEGARASYAQGTKGEEKDARLVAYLWKHHHSSPLEMQDYLIEMSAPAEDWFKLVSPAYRLAIVFAKGQEGRKGVIRIDANNAMRYIHHYPESPLAVYMGGFLIPRTSPYLAQAANQQLKYHDGEVGDPYRSPGSDRINMVNGYDHFWIEDAKDFFSDDLIAELIEVLCPPVGGDLRRISRDNNRSAAMIEWFFSEKRDCPILALASWRVRTEMPLVAKLHLLRHRTLSQNWQSYRYNEYEAHKGLYTPPEWRMTDDKNKQQSSPSQTLHGNKTNKMNRLHGEAAAAGFAAYGYATENDIAREIARLSLPALALPYKGIVKGDAQWGLHLIRLRAEPEQKDQDKHAQAEIRWWAEGLLSLFVQNAPHTMKSLGFYEDLS